MSALNFEKANMKKIQNSIVRNNASILEVMRKNRIESIDFLRGLVMIIMALDHVRDYFFFGSFTSNPTDLATTTPLLFYTRIITHYCAPVFILLTGTSAYLYGAKKNKRDLSKFLFTRCVWLIFLELIVK